MNNTWTPILAPPLTAAVSAAFGLAVFGVGRRMGYPLWVAAVAALFAAAAAGRSCRGRYDRLSAGRRDGGAPPLAALGRLLARQGAFLLMTLVAALVGYALAARAVPADPLTAFGLVEPFRPDGSTAWAAREVWRWLGGLLSGTATAHVLSSTDADFGVVTGRARAR